ncbi:MAG TPA: DegT/DnrJ/EryC1/StrS family aminotransferase [Nocardioidaceae bacterium]|nr:DegT/DnrJ/EryC1/StrS family aminotransferase [Nocardioidaceae bacterium]
MTIVSTTPAAPAIVGGSPAFPTGLALMRPTLPDLPALERKLSSILASGCLTNGPTVKDLEERVAERLGVQHAVAVASCTSGLTLTLQALEARGKVVMPSFTFSASAHAVTWAGGEPVFADITPDTLCVDPESVAAAVAGLPDDAAAITATHIYGTPCSTNMLQAVADQAGVPLVYDAAHGLGSMRQGEPIGGFGTAEVFSLSPTKVMVAGEGGLVTTNDSALAQTLRLGRNYGNPGNYDCVFAGLNARMSELHAAVALHSLSWLDANVARRNELVEAFWAALDGLPGLRRPHVDAGDLSTYKDLTVVVDESTFGLSAAQLAEALQHEGIESRRYYHPSIHAQQAYRHLPSRDLPVTSQIAPAVLSVPLWSHMSDAELGAMADAIVRIQQHAAQISGPVSRAQVTR